MPKNPPPPICPKCSKPMRFMRVKTGGRKFRRIDCDVPDPLKSGALGWLSGEPGQTNEGRLGGDVKLTMSLH